MADVGSYETVVLVDGVAREVVGWSIDRELSGDLPQQVVAVSGVRQASGSIDFAGDEVDQLGRNPFNQNLGWLPRRGQRVQIFVDGNSRFVGVIDKVTGTVSGGFQATIIDDHDRFSSRLNHHPLLRLMPPLYEAEDRRGIGLTALYYVDLACRAAGFYCTPPRERNASLTMHGQTSLWPEVGTIEYSYGMNGQSHATNRGAPWGMALANFAADYIPWGNHTASEPQQITMMVGPNHTGYAYVQVSYTGTTQVMRLAVNTARTATLTWGDTTLASLPLGSATLVSALVKNGAVTLRSNLGATATGSVTLAGSQVDRVKVLADDTAAIAGVQLSHPDTVSADLISTRWTANAVLDTSDIYLLAGIDAAPRIDGVQAGELLEEIGSSILSAGWIDEEGIFRFVPSNVLRGRDPKRTVTTLDDVLSLDWEDSVLHTPSSVTVKGRKPVITNNRWRNVVVWEGSGGELRASETYEEFIEPSSDEDWIQVDETISKASSASNSTWDFVNMNDRTVGGGYFSTDGTEAPDPDSLDFTISMGTLGITRYVITQKVGNLPEGVRLNLQVSETHPVVWPNRRGNPLPRINAYGKTQWTDAEVTAVGISGPGPEIVHDAGPWASHPVTVDGIGRIADYISGQTAASRPVITGLEIVPDPSLRLGDVISIESVTFLGVKMTALIIGISEADSGEMTQTLSVRLINVQTTTTTYAAWQDSLEGGEISYSAFNRFAPAEQTYTSFNGITE